MKQWLTVGLVAFGVSQWVAAAPPAPGTPLSFVSCPIVRDTKTVPCWLAEYEGETYFLTLQTDVSAPVNPPWLGHKVLVEGVVSDEPDICGGVVLKPVALSVMQELDASCNTMLPAEDRYELTFEPPRPPGPSRGRLAFGGFAPPGSLPEDTDFTVDGHFTLQYEFDGLVGFRHAPTLQQILDFATQARARELRIVGYRAASRLSNGDTMLEREGIERERAEQVRDLLKGAGLTQVRYRMEWKDVAASADGKTDASNRRAEVLVVSGRKR
jgi:hypothetical protein